MKTISLSLFLVFTLVLAVSAGSAAPPAADSGSFPPARQLVVVTTTGWNAVEGRLQRYERAAPNLKWKVVGEPIAVVVGKSGLAWGSGMMPAPSSGVSSASAGPVKKEGDGRAPAGVFRLSTAFGYAPREHPGWKMPYVQLTDSVECVDDSNSRFYNRVIDRGTVAADWNSSEHMLRPDELYRWGVVVDHNAGPVRPGGGSCIFLHIWRGAGVGTVGCTAMAPEQLESLLGWLDPGREPLLVQLPASEYKRLRKPWRLPAMPSRN
jgi:L,D-peptidoglycan transpeptidase YkuD (ErfK/YbiS/YcfS/YnhG family)